MSQTPPPNPGTTGPQHTPTQPLPVRIPHPLPARPRTPSPNINLAASQAQPARLNARGLLLLDEFLSKSRLLASWELNNNIHCAICAAPFFHGGDPEVPLRLQCGHVFGMGCILKWLSPVSRGGNNSCPMCRRAVFRDYDMTGFPANGAFSWDAFVPPAVAAQRALNERLAMQRFQASGEVYMNALMTLLRQDTTLSVPESILLLGQETYLLTHQGNWHDAIASQDVGEQTRRIREAGYQYREARDRLIEAQMSNAEQRLESARVRAQHSQDDQEVALRLLNEARQSLQDMTELEDQLQGLARAAQGVRDTIRSIEAPSAAEEATPTSVPPEAAPPTREEDSRVATTEAEHDNQRQQALTKERKRRMWIQFCEGVVRTIEDSPDDAALANHDLALVIINMTDLEEFMVERAAESPMWRRIQRTFAPLHEEMVTRFDDFRPLPSIDIDYNIRLERVLARTRFNGERLHRADWYTRLSKRVAFGITVEVLQARDAGHNAVTG